MGSPVGRRVAKAPDPLTPEQRRLNMSRIRGRNTRPEILLRQALHRAGLRYRLHVRDLPGRPDIVFHGSRAVLLVHGCFWHAHSCPKGVIPATRHDFWVAKLEANRSRDARQAGLLIEAGWRVGVVWECALVGRVRLPGDELASVVSNWLTGRESRLDVAGHWTTGEARAPAARKAGLPPEPPGG